MSDNTIRKSMDAQRKLYGDARKSMKSRGGWAEVLKELDKVAGSTFADLDGDPVRIFMDRYEAWSFVNGAWREINFAEAAYKAYLMTAASFQRRFPDLPSLPEECSI
jgi:hypothetical protein